MVATQAGVNISESADLPGYSEQHSQRLLENGVKNKQTHLLSGNSESGNALLM